MKTAVIVPPTSLPITYQQVSWHMILPDTENKDYVTETMTEATAFAQSEMECSLMPQTLAVTHYEFNSTGRHLLPFGPVQSILSVVDNNGNTINPLNYYLGASGYSDWIFMRVTAALPFTVTYTAGYQTIPADLIRALLVQTSQFYEHREATTDRQQYDTQMGLARIYAKYKRTAQVL